MSGSATLTVTLHLWWLWVYLAIGAVLWLPLEWWAWRNSSLRRQPFWSTLRDSLLRRPYVPVATTMAWPLAVWEVVR